MQIRVTDAAVADLDDNLRSHWTGSSTSMHWSGALFSTTAQARIEAPKKTDISAGQNPCWRSLMNGELGDERFSVSAWFSGPKSPQTHDGALREVAMAFCLPVISLWTATSGSGKNMSMALPLTLIAAEP